MSCWVIPKEKYLRPNQLQLVCGLNPWFLRSSRVCLDVRTGFCCLPFLHALAIPLRNSNMCWEGWGILKTLGLYGQISSRCLWNYIFSVCAGLFFPLHLSWGHFDPWLEMLNTQRGKEFAVSPSGCTIVAEHLLKGRSATIHQGVSFT